MALVIVAAKATSAVPDRMVAVEMTADDHAQARTGATARVLGELQGQLFSGDDIVAADDALKFHAEDLLEIHAAQRHERGGAISRRAAEFGIEGRDEGLAQVAVGGRDRRDTSHAQL